jgi:hypothetical protein
VRDPAEDIRRRHGDHLARVLDAHPIDELVAEHKARPLGPHSDRLSRVLYLIRSAPVIGKHVIVKDPSDSSLWHIATITGRRDEGGIELTGRSARSVQAAEHEIFLMRLAALRETGGRP